MTEKRFKSINCGLQGQYIKDNEIVLTIDEVVELLNEFAEENEQLKGEVAHYKLILMGLEREAKRLSEIKRNWE